MTTETHTATTYAIVTDSAAWVSVACSEAQALDRWARAAAAAQDSGERAEFRINGELVASVSSIAEIRAQAARLEAGYAEASVARWGQA